MSHKEEPEIEPKIVIKDGDDTYVFDADTPFEKLIALSDQGRFYDKLDSEQKELAKTWLDQYDLKNTKKIGDIHATKDGFVPQSTDDRQEVVITYVHQETEVLHADSPVRDLLRGESYLRHEQELNLNHLRTQEHLFGEFRRAGMLPEDQYNRLMSAVARQRDTQIDNKLWTIEFLSLWIDDKIRAHEDYGTPILLDYNRFIDCGESLNRHYGPDSNIQALWRIQRSYENGGLTREVMDDLDYRKLCLWIEDRADENMEIETRAAKIDFIEHKSGDEIKRYTSQSSRDELASIKQSTLSDAERRALAYWLEEQDVLTSDNTIVVDCYGYEVYINRYQSLEILRRLRDVEFTDREAYLISSDDREKLDSWIQQKELDGLYYAADATASLEAAPGGEQDYKDKLMSYFSQTKSKLRAAAEKNTPAEKDNKVDAEVKNSSKDDRKISKSNFLGKIRNRSKNKDMEH